MDMLSEIYTPAREGLFLARLLDKEDVDDVWYYSWERVVGAATTTDVVTVDNGDEGSADVNPAVELNNLEIEIPDPEDGYVHVWMKLRGMTADLGPVYEFDGSGPVLATAGGAASLARITSTTPDVGPGSTVYYPAKLVTWRALDGNWIDGDEIRVKPNAIDEIFVVGRRYFVVADNNNETQSGFPIYLSTATGGYATATQDGIVSTITQSFGGPKLFFGTNGAGIATARIETDQAGATQNYVGLKEASVLTADIDDGNAAGPQLYYIRETRVRSESIHLGRSNNGKRGGWIRYNNGLILYPNTDPDVADLPDYADYAYFFRAHYDHADGGQLQFVLGSGANRALGGYGPHYPAYCVDVAFTRYVGEYGQLADGSVVVGGVVTTISTGAIAVARGGTGLTTVATGAVLTGDGTGALVPVSPGASGGVLTSNGPGVAPSFEAPTAASYTNAFKFGVD